MSKIKTKGLQVDHNLQIQEGENYISQETYCFDFFKFSYFHIMLEIQGITRSTSLFMTKVIAKYTAS